MDSAFEGANRNLWRRSSAGRRSPDDKVRNPPVAKALEFERWCRPYRAPPLKGNPLCGSSAATLGRQAARKSQLQTDESYHEIVLPTATGCNGRSAAWNYLAHVRWLHAGAMA